MGWGAACTAFFRAWFSFLNPFCFEGTEARYYRHSIQDGCSDWVRVGAQGGGGRRAVCGQVLVYTTGTVY